MVGVVALAVTAGGLAWGAIPDPGTSVIHGCYATATGALRVIDQSKGQSCSGSEDSLSWNQRGIDWRGAWNSSTAYALNDAVRVDGSSYVARTANTNSEPPNSNWLLVASRGGPGAKGTPGPSYAKVDSTGFNPIPMNTAGTPTTVATTSGQPAGNYLVTGQVEVYVDGGDVDVNCDLSDQPGAGGTEANDIGETSGPPASVQTFSVEDAFPGESAGKHIVLECSSATGDSSSIVYYASITAVQVGTLVYNGTTYH